MCKLFCEDPATSQSDEFFGVFDLFLASFAEAKQENDNLRRKREEEEKIAKQHQEVSNNGLYLVHKQGLKIGHTKDYNIPSLKKIRIIAKKDSSMYFCLSFYTDLHRVK